MSGHVPVPLYTLTPLLQSMLWLVQWLGLDGLRVCCMKTCPLNVNESAQ